MNYSTIKCLIIEMKSCYLRKIYHQKKEAFITIKDLFSELKHFRY